ncbi:TetR/AcrR family transcriptional regulator [Nocardia alni]|uniref:TetR/AcrR family transcriptional regulator n=1 Tax=Nocardia alni TaxID=2815723 RepID=UPI001C231142|nr:TetR/AcrR family transcriptional regulator [Nocardia alni]
MSSADDSVGEATGEPLTSRRYTAAQRRTADTALTLFSERGVSGTSLQMIADALGVTKAAVYHQFRTKDEIVLAVAEIELSWLEAAVAAAEAQDSDVRAREVLLTDVVDLAVRRRNLVGVLQGDPVMIRFLAEYEPFAWLMERLFAVLAGAEPDTDMRVQAAMMAAAIGGAAIHPVVAELDDDTLRGHLLSLTRRLFRLDE